MSQASTSKYAEIPYIRGIVPMAVVVFVIASIPSVMGIFYLITNPEVREIRYFSGLLVWIFLAYLFASIIRVKISFLSNGIMVKDGIWLNVRRLFFPYQEIKHIRVNGSKFSIRMGRFSSYTYLIKKDDLHALKEGIEIYEKWKRKEDGSPK